jgi:hypothetical protein
MKENLFLFNGFNETHMLHEFKIHQTKGNMDDGSNFDKRALYDLFIFTQ